MNPPTLSSSILDTIGHTPLVALDRFARNAHGRILAKLEYFNPGFSKKDRIAQCIIETAEQDGSLIPGQTVVELTSGNTGTGLAIVCAVRGYPFVAVMSRGNSPERARMMRALGAEVVLVEQAPGSPVGQVSGEDLSRVEAAAVRLTQERRAFRADQFGNRANSKAHAEGTAREIIEQCGGAVDAFCNFVGTGGTLAGCAQTFKSWRPDFRCYAVEPASAAVLAGKEVTRSNHRIQGGGYARSHLDLLPPDLVDGFITVTDDEAIACARRLAREEGIFGGFSGGANAAAALQLLKTELAGKTIVILICDTGLKYLSTDLWE